MDYINLMLQIPKYNLEFLREVLQDEISRQSKNANSTDVVVVRKSETNIDFLQWLDKKVEQSLRR